MSDQPFDPDQYKAGQQKQWDSVSAGWGKWWPTLEGFSQPVSDRLMELANIGEGQMILDVATGIGEPALTAAKRVGPTGKVIATDHSDGMLQIARDRAADGGLTNVEFLQIDGGSLDFEEATFDAVTCRWGLMFMPDLDAALKAIHRSLKPGGRFVTTVWGLPENTPGISLALGVVRKLLQLPPPPPEVPNMFKLAPPGVVDAALTAAGFGGVETESMMVDFQYDSVEEYTEFFQDIAAPIRMMLADHPPEKSEEAWQAITAEVSRLADADGRVILPSETLITVGQK